MTIDTRYSCRLILVLHERFHFWGSVQSAADESEAEDTSSIFVMSRRLNMFDRRLSGMVGQKENASHVKNGLIYL